MSGEIASERLGPPLLHNPAPEFRARTTMGERALSDYRGGWLLFFSHPADFTPVCTSEFVAFAKAARRFRELGCELLGLSVDSLFTSRLDPQHPRAFRDRGFVSGCPRPLDGNRPRLGMIAPRAPDMALVRAAYVIDPNGIIRAITWYPMTTGRNVEELLRLIAALQVSDMHEVATPEGWVSGDDVILPAPAPAADASAREGDGSEWYYRTSRLADVARRPERSR